MTEGETFPLIFQFDVDMIRVGVVGPARIARRGLRKPSLGRRVAPCVRTAGHRDSRSARASRMMRRPAPGGDEATGNRGISQELTPMTLPGFFAEASLFRS